MPRKEKASYQEYMREYMRSKRKGLTGINTGINTDLGVGARGFEPPTSASRTLRATRLRYTPFVNVIIRCFNYFQQDEILRSNN